MKVSWSRDREDQLMYYANQSAKVAQGFFQRIRAVIVPYLHESGWYLPDYDLFENSEFIHHVSLLGVDTFFVTNKQLLSIIDARFDLDISDEEINYEKSAFEKNFDSFLILLEQFFPVVSKISELKIVPTKFGTGSSYFWDTRNEKEIRLIITFRLDYGYQYALRGMISAIVWYLTKQDGEHLELWRIRTGIGSFLSAHTSFGKFFDDESKQSTLTFTDGYKGELLEDCTAYYQKMGYPLTSAFSYSDNTIFFNNKPLLGLTNKEIDIMMLLIDKKSQIVTFDEVGDVYWKDDPDSFSLYALAKVIEKLRTTLQNNGVPQAFIRTVRKRGYLLFD